MLSEFKDEISAHNLCHKKDHILLAVSGGIDSMTMLHLFRQSSYALGVAHINFQLRNNESDEDESFVVRTCRQQGIRCHNTRIDVAEYAQTHRLSVQVAARVLRYAWFNETLAREGYDYIATAHHLNDDVETFILNLIRGSGLAGFKGIPIKVEKIIRPLLSFSRQEIKQYARKNNVLWREDTTNSNLKYDRNKIRSQVVPVLKGLNPSLEKTFTKTRQRLAGAQELLDIGKKFLVDKFITVENDGIKIDKSTISDLKNPIPIIWEVIKKYGFNYDQCHSIVKGWRQNSGKKFLSQTHQLIIDRQFIVIGVAQKIQQSVIISKEDTLAIFGSRHMKIEFSDQIGISRDRSIAALDADTIDFPIQWRKWQAGDYFYPLGMTQRKKVSDFFIDKKLSLVEKDRATVVESNGAIIWLAGYRIDNRFRVTDKTTHILNLVLAS